MRYLGSAADCPDSGRFTAKYSRCARDDRETKARIDTREPSVQNINRMQLGLHGATWILILAVAAIAASSPARPRPKRDVYYDSSIDAGEEYLLGLLRNRLSHPALLDQQKRAGGLLDFGVSRGASGAEAAKARLGLKLAHDPYGPGRR
ncbi:diuretic hormone class 2-like isoform X1 [Dermacentor albipictus]|uniref:diuretic hormone class 2-like isoform X1 n=2 Tax=Dermacentor albipictus TaxID=60249 RepID=UPI0038FC3C37